MKLLFLGTSSGVPTLSRNVSALAVLFDQTGEWWLIDCGEGTQQQVLKAGLALSRLRRIFISHFHGDHCYGLPGLLASRGMQTGSGPLDVYGPKGITAFLKGIFAHSGAHPAYPLEVHEPILPALLCEDDEYAMRAVEVPHRGPSTAYVLTEKPRAGRFKVEEAHALRIPPGPLFGRLKNGETVTLPDGRVIDGSTLVEAPRPGRKAVIACDTYDARAVLADAQHATVIVHEATFSAREGDLPRQRGHASAADAGRFAREAQASQLILTHFSPRYDNPQAGSGTIQELIKEAEAEFAPGRVIAAKDFWEYELPKIS